VNSEIFRIAWQNLRLNRLRTMLTTLGIIIGVASITFVMALGEGARDAVGKQVEKLDSNVALVKPGKPTAYDLNPYRTAITTSLTERDYNSVRELPDVTHAAPLMVLGGSIKADSRTFDGATIIATSQALPKVLNLTVRSGQFIDDVTARDTVVLGQRLAVELFGTDQAMGQSVLLKGRPHTVIGVVKNTNTPINISGIDLDTSAYVSLDDGKSFNQGIAQIQQLSVQVKDAAKMDNTVKRIEETLLKNHDGERDFTVLGGSSLTKGADKFFETVVIITSIVSIITLLVSGIGVMNILLVGVTERTREIGIRKALGATDYHIVGQFLVESLIMCITGGLIGLVLAYALAFLVGSQLSFQPSFDPIIPLIGFGLALFVGVAFGLYPALKAARKDPIEALRQYQ